MSKQIQLWSVVAETPHYTFMTVGFTRQECIDQFAIAWEKHCADCGADINYWASGQSGVGERYAAIVPQPIAVGVVYRDGAAVE